MPDSFFFEIQFQNIEAVQGVYNFCLLKRHRNGQDSMGMHADDEPEMGNVIGSLSLGGGFLI